MNNIHSFNVNGVDSSINLADSSNNGLMSSESYNKVEDLVQNNLSIADLDIADDNDNVLVRFSQGNFRTKNFDSIKVVTSDQLDEKADKSESVTIGEHNYDGMTIEDASGNIEIYVRNGYIYTKNFNSKDVINSIAEISNADSGLNLDSVINIICNSFLI